MQLYGKKPPVVSKHPARFCDIVVVEILWSCKTTWLYWKEILKVSHHRAKFSGKYCFSHIENWEPVNSIVCILKRELGYAS